MKAIAINGSPRKKWNTAQAIDSAAEGLRDSGFEVERIDLTITPTRDAPAASRAS